MDTTIVTITGNLTKDPTLAIRDTKDGPMAVCNFYVAATEKTHAGQEQKLYFRIAIWGDEAENAAMLRKGQRVQVTGHLRLPSTWTNATTGEIGVTHQVSADWKGVKVWELTTPSKPKMEVLDLRDQVTA